MTFATSGVVSTPVTVIAADVKREELHAEVVVGGRQESLDAILCDVLGRPASSSSARPRYSPLPPPFSNLEDEDEDEEDDLDLLEDTRRTNPPRTPTIHLVYIPLRHICEHNNSDAHLAKLGGKVLLVLFWVQRP